MLRKQESNGIEKLSHAMELNSQEMLRNSRATIRIAKEMQSIESRCNGTV